MAINSANPTTMGVYRFANTVMNRSELDFRFCSFCSSSIIFETLESLYAFVTRIFSRLAVLMLPLNTALPGAACRGTDSPVRAEVSRKEHPSMTSPSRGTFYLYVKAPTGMADGTTFATAEDFSQYMIREKMISVVPWDDAGHYVRFSLTFHAPTAEFVFEER